ncbi:condensin subunit BRN1 PWA37_001454 [Arxiozyma heterogenica]|uniref:condensin subunit BRN1 n=1 Tax=Arxiozyma heterogenica TaxID=278026 RepID=UPI002EDBEB72
MASQLLPSYGNDENDQGLFTNRSVMMANFEEWIKMATDNKINPRNSWNFALIDYFHDLNVLMDAENKINFQKASATLDGCVKIYASRVDSVSDETGRLLSGLAQRKTKGKSNSDSNSNSNISNSRNNDSSRGTNLNGESDNNDNANDPEGGLPRRSDINNDSDVDFDDNRDEGKRSFRHARILETTLVEFDAIKMKYLDQELNIDPLFKKALVDFDEGGAKSLLLNTLNIDPSGRVIFDATIQDGVAESDNNRNANENNNPDNITSASEMDENSKQEDIKESENSHIYNTSIIEDEILTLGMEFLKFNKITECEISSSLGQLRSLVDDINKEQSFIETINNKSENFLTEQELAEAIPTNDIPDLNDDGIPDLEYSMLQDEMDENSITNDPNSNITTTDKHHNNNNIPTNPKEVDEVDNLISDSQISKNNNISTIVDPDGTITNGLIEQDLMAYFDETMKKNWRGREHWKVRNIKKDFLHQTENNDTKNSITDTSKSSEENQNAESKDNDKVISDNKSKTGENHNPICNNKNNSKKKQPLELDFFTFEDDLEDKIFVKPIKPSIIELPQRLRIEDSHYLLPDDYHFTSEKIVRLFIKPEQKMSLFNSRKKNRPSTRYNSTNIINEEHSMSTNKRAVTGEAPEIADENFWAENYRRKEQEDNEGYNEDGDDENVRGAEVENPFDEDNENGIDFNQAFDNGDDFDDNDVSDHKTEEDLLNGESKLQSKDKKITFARVAKRIDVRKLKNNVWKSIVTLIALSTDDSSSTFTPGKENSQDIINLKFTDISHELFKRYTAETFKDISTSFQFICLLHLANEYGFQVKKIDTLDNLEIEIDRSKLSHS